MAKQLLIYKEPIKVICINPKNSKKLIKNAIYSATSIGTHYNNIYRSSGTDRFIRISIGLYSTECFTLLNGNSLENEPDFIVEDNPNLDFTKNYIDQCVRCCWSTSKMLKNGEIYYVEDQRITNRFGSYAPYHQVKIRGLKKWISANNFKEIHISEQRKIKLKTLKGEKIKTGEETRKFLHYLEKERMQILFQLLSSSLIDINGAETLEPTDISKIILNKGKQYNIIIEDIIPFLNNLKTLLKPYNFIW